VPAFTWIATANAVEYVGAHPVFCDIDLRSYNIDVSKIESLVNERTKAVIPVHLFGLCADMAPILSLARRHGLRVVEDAACALGAWYGDGHAGTFGDVGCFSFHPRKSVTTGEGGMLTTACEEWAALARQLRDHGAGLSDRARHEGQANFLLPEFEHLGFNYRMTDLQGALGCAQMGKAQHLLDARQRLAARYDRLLSRFRWLRTPPVPGNGRHGYQAYVCLFAPGEPVADMVEAMHRQRNRIMASWRRQGSAPDQVPMRARAALLRPQVRPGPIRFSVGSRRRTVDPDLPLFPQMQEGEQDRVVQALSEAFEHVRDSRICDSRGVPVDRADLEGMTAAMVHRGPDGAGVFLDGCLGLGHRRLAVLDISAAGHQPMSTGDGRLTIVYNGEVYNFRNCARSWRRSGAPSRRRPTPRSF